MIKVGYYGIEGSYAYQAAEEMVKNLNIEEVSYVSCNSPKDVINKLKNNDVTHIVLPVKNSIVGIIEETTIAFNTCNSKLELIATTILSTHHCLVTKNSDIKNEDIKKIISDRQTINQCDKYIKNHFKNCRLQIVDIADQYAKEMADDNNDVAIICSKKIKDEYNLHLLKKNIEDEYTNKTEYRMLKINRYSKPKNKELIKKGRVYSLIRKWVSRRTLQGYWKCFIVSEKNDQKLNKPIVLKIENNGDEYLIKVWECGDKIHKYISYEAITSSLKKNEGILIFSCKKLSEKIYKMNFNHIVKLKWKVNPNTNKVDYMDGIYKHFLSYKNGQLECIKINDEAFEQFIDNKFL